MSADIDVFRDAGPVGRDLAAVDWAQTALGTPETWPQSLISVVRVLVRSRFAMWMAWGPDLTFFCNDAYRRDTLGTKYPWALGRPAREVWTEIWPDISPRIDHVLRTGEATWDEGLLLFLERHGYTEESYHTFSYSPLDDDAGDTVGMLCVVSEVTDGVIGTRRMATLRDLSSAVASATGEAEVLEAATRSLAGDPHSLPFTLLYAFDPAQGAKLVGSSGIDPAHPAADPERWPATLLEQGIAVDVALDVPDLPSGAWPSPPTRARITPLLPPGESPYGFLVAGVTPFRQLDAEYAGFVDLVAGQVAGGLGSARAYDAERRRAESLAALDRDKTAFFMNVSHEFRTPLTLLLGPAEDALADLDEPLGPAQRQRLEIIARNGQRLLKLVNSLLDFSRLEAGHAAGRFEAVDLAQLTTDLASSFSEAVERLGLSLEIACDPVGEPVWVDPDMWSKVVLNLLSNAMKFTFEGGVGVRLSRDGDAVSLTVTDTGVGVPVAEQEHLFERFHRVSGARSRTHEGTGIGLALVAELVALHGGTVSVVSEPGRGSAFTVTLPTGSAHLPQPQLVAGGEPDVHVSVEGFLAETEQWLGARAPREVPAGTRARRRVLVVDDNPDMRDYVEGLLRLDHQVVTAVDGREALELALAEPPDLVLTDVMMPRMDGFELLTALRAEPRTEGVPVIVLSARAGEESVVDGLDSGADDYLAKPFSAAELRARVRSQLELDRVRRVSDQLTRSQVLLDQAQRLSQVGSWELDPRTGVVRASEEFLRQLELGEEHLREHGFERLLEERIVPQDHALVLGAVRKALAGGASFEYEVRATLPVGGQRRFRTVGEVLRDADGEVVGLRGSNQDVTEQRQAEAALAAAAGDREALAREHRIADELQRSLLPERDFSPDHLEIATFYRAGVEGTQVGGDWFDVIELGAGRTALVLGDVMGRGVRAAAVMGQLRTAVRAYARLDLPPADVLEHLDGVVRELGEDQIVTCVYAVYDPGDRTLTWANAGHLPLLLRLPGERTQRLTGAINPPLGVSSPSMTETSVQLPTGALLALFTDGLIERRGGDLDAGLDAVARLLDQADGPLAAVPDALTSAMLPEGLDDDVALLVVRVDQAAQEEVASELPVASDPDAVAGARHAVVQLLHGWGVGRDLVDDVELLLSELVTNAILYGQPPVTVRLRRSRAHLVLEVVDSAVHLPRRMRPSDDDEHGRGLQLASLLADRWGVRPLATGKVVWCLFSAR